MKHAKLDSMKKGWFVGNFDPSLLKTNDCEVAVKKYKKGDHEDAHFRKVATELTVIVSGKVRMFNSVFVEDDIIIIEPGEITDFLALEDSVNVVVKIPGANNDKYEVRLD